MKELTVLCLIIFPCFGGDSIVWAPGPSGGGGMVVVVRNWGRGGCTVAVGGGGRRDPGPITLEP